MHTKLNIHQLEIPVLLGWSEEERRKKQLIYLDVEIHFATPPQACASDQLKDTFCYYEFSQVIGKSIAQKEYRLIELLTQNIYERAKEYFGNESSVKISVTKKPELNFQNQGVTFTYGDH